MNIRRTYFDGELGKLLGAIPLEAGMRALQYE